MQPIISASAYQLGLLVMMRGGDDDAVRGIAVKGTGQVVQRQDDRHVARKKLDDGRGGGLKNPGFERNLGEAQMLHARREGKTTRNSTRQSREVVDRGEVTSQRERLHRAA